MFPILIPRGGRLDPVNAALFVGLFLGGALVFVMFWFTGTIFSHPALKQNAVTMGQLRNGTAVCMDPSEIAIGKDGSVAIPDNVVPSSRPPCTDGTILVSKHWYAWLVYSRGYKFEANRTYADLETQDTLRTVWFVN